MEYVIAKYIRLSIEDAKNESLSIENQRLFLDNYIAAMGVADATVIELVDNGYTGTDYERPGVQELMELVRSGKVNCILVKDFSRFGRNVIETGYFLQRVFPLFRTRFIAISDGYDSAEHDGDTGGLDVSFRLLIHEQYSRDLSRKIRASKNEKARRGEAVFKNCAFGYKKVGNRLEIDETAAETVRLIFDMAASGSSLAEIAARLYRDKRLTPSEYRNAAEGKQGEHFSYIWNLPVIYLMLYDEQYIGTYIAGKRKRSGVGSSRHDNIDKADWVRIPEYHPAIIDKAVFLAAQESISYKPESQYKRKLSTWQRYNPTASPLKGKVVCGCCDHRLKLSSTRNAAFTCQYTSSAHDMPCYRMRIMERELSAMILDAVRRQVCGHQDGVERFVKIPAKSNADIMRLIERTNREKQSLYESFVRGEMNADEFKEAKMPFDAESERLSLANEAIMADVERLAMAQASESQMREVAETAFRDNTLSKSLVEMLVEKVYVYPDNRITAVWKMPGFDASLREGK